MSAPSTVGPPPDVLPAAPRALPPSAATTLATGLQVLAVRDASVPMVELRLRVSAPAEQAANLASTVMLGETVLTGTAERDRAELAEDLQRLGGGLGAAADVDGLAIDGSALAEHLPALLDLLAAVLTSATYADDEVSLERERTRQRLRVALTQPATRASRTLLARLYGSHPYARQLPTDEEVADVTAAGLRALHAERIGARGGQLVLVGALDPDEALREVERALASWTAEQPIPTIPVADPLQPGVPALVDRPGSVQTTIRAGGAAPPRTDPGWPALKLANLVYGGYFSSRLVLNIREDKGYTYSPRSSVVHDRAGSRLVVGADVATEVTAPALHEIRAELARIAVVPVGAGELDAARRYAEGSLLLSTQTQAGLASTLVALAGDGLGPSYLRDHPEALREVSVEAVSEAAGRFFAPVALHTVLVGDVAAIRPSVGRLVATEVV